VQYWDHRVWLSAESDKDARFPSVKKIGWTEEFSVGHSAMDFQHQKIVNLFNTLVDHVLESPRSEKISEVMNDMLEYASEHFRCEAQLLRDCGYRELAEQQASHRQYRRQVGELCVLLSAGDEGVVSQMLEFLHDWWTNHILVEDKKYAAILKKGVSS
jgi:hemerythrin-like metal-binding protein